MEMLNSDVIKSIYNYNLYKLPSMNREIREYKYDILNRKVSKIQKWYKRNKIDRQMPILFISEIDLYQKWYIIRLYMKFYPKDDLRILPKYVFRKKVFTSDIECEKEKKFVMRRDLRIYEVFEYLKSSRKIEILAAGW